MINADQARALAKEENTTELTRFLKAVEEKIIIAINNGYHICFMDVEGYNYFSITTCLVSSIHVVFAPSLSATTLTGTYVRSFKMVGATP